MVGANPSPAGPHTAPLLDVRNLRVEFATEDGVVPAVNDVSFDLKRGETVCIVGESGSGKSVTSLAIMGLVRFPPGRIVNGEILFHHEGRQRSLTTLGERQYRRIRGNDIAMIFQEPMTALNPVYTVGEQIAEAIRC